MNNIRRLFLVAAASAVAALAPSALAADPPTYVAFDAEGWRFATAIEAEGNILGFLSWVTDGTATGNNVTLL